MKTNLRKKHIIQAQGTVEIGIVVFLFFLFLVFLLDIALLFRQIYIVQSVSDELVVRLKTAGVCYYNPNAYGAIEDEDEILNLEKRIKNIMLSSINHHFNKNYNLNNINTDRDITEKSGIYTTFDNEFYVALNCKSPSSPNSLVFAHKYKGLFMYLKGKYIQSDISTDTSLF